MLEEIEISVPQILVILTLVTAGYVAFQLSFDPLRKHPGPLVARFTSCYGALYVWRKCMHLVAAKLHDQYGPVVRLAPNRLVFSSAAAIPDIYNNSRVSKSTAYIQFRDPGGKANLFNTLDKSEQKSKRRIIAPVIGDSSMRTFEPEMKRQIDFFLLELLRSSHQHEVVNASDRCERLGIDIVGQLGFGYQLDTQRSATHRDFIKGLKYRADLKSIYYFCSGLSIFQPIFDIYGMMTSMKVYESIRTMIQARMKLPKDHTHDFYALASDKLGSVGPGSVNKTFWSEAILFVAAGGSTTATAMSGVFFYLSRNPEAYDRLACEIRTAFASGDDIKLGPELTACKYLHAVIDETMRMSPSASDYTWRQQDPASIAAGEVLVVDGHVIPAGTHFAVSHYNLQHDEAYFPEPFKFRPERWLVPDPAVEDTAEQQEKRKAMRRAFAPFSMGDRACAGKPMAWAEMKLAVAKTFWYFDFQRALGKAGELGGGWKGGKDGRERVDEFQLYSSLVTDHTGPNLIFTPRGDYWKELRETAKVI